MKNKLLLRRKAAVFSVTLTAVFFLSMWCHDLAATSIMNGLTLYNGFFTTNAAQMYHISFYAMAACFMAMMFYKWEQNQEGK